MKHKIKKKENRQLILFWDIFIALSIAATIYVVCANGNIGLIFAIVPAYCFWCRENTMDCIIKEELCEEMISKLEQYAQIYKEN